MKWLHTVPPAQAAAWFNTYLDGKDMRTARVLMSADVTKWISVNRHEIIALDKAGVIEAIRQRAGGGTYVRHNELKYVTPEQFAAADALLAEMRANPDIPQELPQ